MSKIKSLDELKDGDVVFVFGRPFYDHIVRAYNPFIYCTPPSTLHYNNFVSQRRNDVSQSCTWLRDDTRIYKKDEFTTEDKAELILEGYGDWLNE